MKNLIVDKKFNNKKLSSFLLENFNGLTINTVYKSLRKKDIIVNGCRIKENITVYENDNVTIYISDNLLYKKFNLNIVYEDENIIIVNKPIDIEVVNSSSEKSLQDYVCEYFNNTNIKACHRIDRNTTGLVLFAKNKTAHEILLYKFKNNEIEKKYKATVYGIPKKNHEVLKAYLFKDTKKSLVYISDIFQKGYQKIITEYNIISKNAEKNIAILEITLHTGRTHQIRAHLAHIGYPIIGDR